MGCPPALYASTSVPSAWECTQGDHKTFQSQCHYPSDRGGGLGPEPQTSSNLTNAQKMETCRDALSGN